MASFPSFILGLAAPLAAFGHAHDLLQQLGEVGNVHADNTSQNLVDNGQHQRCANAESQPPGNAGEKVQLQDFAGLLRQLDVFGQARVIQPL